MHMLTDYHRDEILYHAKIHPEQYSNTLGDDQIKELHTCIHYVCQTAYDLLADSEKFPPHWLFKHRWGKGKKNQTSVLPNGDKITFLTVGGRTSAVVPAVQKKTGAVSKDTDDDESRSTDTKRKRTIKEESDNEGNREQEPKKGRVSKQKASKAVKVEDNTETKPPKEEKIGRRRSTRSKN